MQVGDPMKPSPRSAWFIVVLLLAAYTLSFVDRYILTLLVEPMKRDLALSDTEVSLLHGLAFAVLYSVAGLPMGRWVDRADRTKIVAWGIAVWSAMTALCGLAHSYWQLFLARVGVGVGEATLSPAAYSMISDSFRGRQLGLALGVYNLGATIGAALAMMIGGTVVQAVMGMPSVSLPIIGEIRAWQLTFLYVGPPGLVLALIFARLREPPRDASVRRSSDGAVAAVPISELVAFVKRNAAALTFHHLGLTFISLSVFGAVSWLPVLLVRVHGWQIGAIGHAIGLALLAGGLLGSLGGGWLSDRFKSAGDSASRMWVGLIVSIIGIPAGATFALVGDPLLSVALFSVVYFCTAAALPAVVATLNECAPNQLRGQLAAIFIFVTNIIAVGLGATLVALLSDLVFTEATGVRYSLAVVTPIGFTLAAVSFALSFRPLRRTLANEREVLDKPMLEAAT